MPSTQLVLNAVSEKGGGKKLTSPREFGFSIALSIPAEEGRGAGPGQLPVPRTRRGRYTQEKTPAKTLGKRLHQGSRAGSSGKEYMRLLAILAASLQQLAKPRYTGKTRLMIPPKHRVSSPPASSRAKQHRRGIRSAGTGQAAPSQSRRTKLPVTNTHRSEPQRSPPAAASRGRNEHPPPPPRTTPTPGALRPPPGPLCSAPPGLRRLPRSWTRHPPRLQAAAERSC